MEIGGFFEFAELNYHHNKDSVLNYLLDQNGSSGPVFYRDGRQAIKSVLLDIADLNKKICLLPSYLCKSIKQPFKELELNTRYYGHQPGLKPVIESRIKDTLMYIIDYFGVEMISNDEILELTENNIVILDITHSLFDEKRLRLKHENLYSIASLRKSFPIPDGSIVHHASPDFETIEDAPEGYEKMLEAMFQKKYYVSNHYANKGLKRHFLTLYRDYEDLKDNNTIKLERLPEISRHIMKHIAIDPIVCKRKSNLQYIYDNIDRKQILFELDQIRSPFCVPLVFDTEQERERCKRKLIGNDVFPPVHWELPDDVPRSFAYEHRLSRRILSIPIDQRYSEEQLSTIVNTLWR